MPKKSLPIIGFWAVLFLMVLNACNQKMETTMTSSAAWEKMDASLRTEIRGNMESGNNAALTVLARVTEDNEEFVSALNAIDIDVLSRIGTVWTLRGNAQSLAQASREEFVKRMELSQVRSTS